MAVVWSNDGSGMSNGDTVRLYVNNVLELSTNTTWTVSDTKSVDIKFGGGISQLSTVTSDCYGSGIFDNIKVHNYCKTYFDLGKEGEEFLVKPTPNDFVEISTDNINFYGLGSQYLPVTFSGVSAGERKSVYVRSNKTIGFGESALSTGQLLVEWVLTV